LIWIILVRALVLNVVLVVHVLGGSLCMATRLDSVVLVHSFGLGELVDLTTHETGEKLLGELVRDWLAFLALVIFVKLEALESSTASNHLM